LFIAFEIFVAGCKKNSVARSVETVVLVRTTIVTISDPPDINTSMSVSVMLSAFAIDCLNIESLEDIPLLFCSKSSIEPSNNNSEVNTFTYSPFGKRGGNGARGEGEDGGTGKSGGLNGSGSTGGGKGGEGGEGGCGDV